MKKCEVCEKGTLKPKKVTSYQYHTPMGAIAIEGASKLEECANCGERFVPGKLIDKWNQLIMERLTFKEGFLVPAELQFVFSVLPYSQAEVAKATGKERSTLTKYKNGENPIDALFDYALRKIMAEYLKGKNDTMELLKKRQQFVFKGESIKKIAVH